MPLTEDDDMVKALPPDRANQPFRMSILPWRAGRGWPVANAHGTKPPGEKFAVDSVAIADDVAWCPFPAAGFDVGPSIQRSGVPLRRAIRSGAGHDLESASHKATETRVSEQLGL